MFSIFNKISKLLVSGDLKKHLKGPEKQWDSID